MTFALNLLLSISIDEKVYCRRQLAFVPLRYSSSILLRCQK